MRILIVSGIWPPDVGGPASHGPALGAYLVDRGHAVQAVTSRGAAPPALVGFPVRAARRDRPRVVRQPAAALAVSGSAIDVDAIYSTGMYTRSTVAARAGGRPLVLKLASDPAYERARRAGIFRGTLEEFEQDDSPPLRAIKALRSAVVRRADRLVVPSRYLAAFVEGWGIDAEAMTVIPNPAPPVPNGVDRATLRRRLGITGPLFVFAGRLVRAKNLPLALAALRDVPRASLVVIGEGPETDRVREAVATHGLETRVEMLGALPRSQVIDWLRAADAALLPSDWENFPHGAVESLAAGTPVVATRVGGVPEIVRDGVEGLLVERGDEAGLAAAMRSVAEDPARAAELRAGAAAGAKRYDARVAFAAIEEQIATAARGRAG